MTHYLSTTNGQQSPGETPRDGDTHTRHADDVTRMAKEQSREVVSEATRQARDLYAEARDQLTRQAGEQQRRAATGLRSLADEMHSMAEYSGQTGPVTEIARQAAARVHDAAGWLEWREPGDLLGEVREYARRDPGTFLAGAALLGVLAGRLTRNVGSSDNGYSGGPGSGAEQVTPASGYDADQTVVLPSTPPGSATPPDTGHGRLPPATVTDPLPGVPSSGVRP